MNRFEFLLKASEKAAGAQKEQPKTEMESQIERLDSSVNSRKISLKASKRFITARSTLNFSEYVLTHKCNGVSQ